MHRATAVVLFSETKYDQTERNITEIKFTLTSSPNERNILVEKRTILRGTNFLMCYVKEGGTLEFKN